VIADKRSTALDAALSAEHEGVVRHVTVERYNADHRGQTELITDTFCPWIVAMFGYIVQQADADIIRPGQGVPTHADFIMFKIQFFT